ncbi:hypothetical protein [Rhizobium lentis]|uniref:Uncharacterized protein n=1 Tax=Rhizobium lentis TaxID=1138194 RepID=A0A9Q3MA50_9HYPH|nr:hypothetical protein [Rhizobium lentis]MBX4956418.1 hypothetical protein [Rhizobium lentis]MBX4974822.1 hypothetical protein [Rhizobium lentis]MBX4986116.1 hypothetical protein [Rhizobium lentis]MBX4997869.1 hypothetical protein [Rhizobium lentis]MBX5004560.1 hypothetical protein [Rhizobium lentis]
MADSGAVEIPPAGGIEGNHRYGSVHSRFAAGRKPATGVGHFPDTHVRVRTIKGREKTRVYKDLNENLVNRKILLECSKNAKKANDKAQSLS